MSSEKLYPKRLINKVIKTFLDKKIEKDREDKAQKPDIDIRYIKLRYIKESSTSIKGKIKYKIKYEIWYERR